MIYKRLKFVTLLLAGWTLGASLTSSLREQQADFVMGEQLAQILVNEVESSSLSNSVVWNHLLTLPRIQAAQWNRPNEPSETQGQPIGPPQAQIQTRAGQLLLWYRERPWNRELLVCWLISAGLLTQLALQRKRRIRGATLVEVDEHGNILQVRGAQLGKAGTSLQGQSVTPLLRGLTLSQVQGQGQRLVVARDSETIQQVKERLRRLESQYRSLCDNAHDLIFVAQPESTLIYFNQSAKESLGEIPESTSILDLFEDESKATAEVCFRACLLEGTTRTFQATLKLNDRSLPVEGSFCPGKLESGLPETILAIFRDLTQILEAEEQLRQAQKMEAIGRLAGGVAHDFNNLLTIMAGLSSLIRLSESQLDREVEDNLEQLDRTIERAGELTRQLLLFSRRKVKASTRVDLDQTLKGLYHLAHRLIGEDIQLTLDFQSGTWVEADRSEIEQVGMNLLVNARDAMPLGGKLDISTRPTQVKGVNGVLWSVKDTGSGMKRAILERIFEPYFTTKEAGKGTGLGLSTSYAIITRMGGQIDVASQVGVGTTFSLFLPASSAPALQGQSSQPTLCRGRESIMLVEDEQALCQATSKNLQLLGYQVSAWTSPLEAIAWLAQSKEEPSLLITDLVMPGMTGTELAQKACQLKSNLKVLYVSGYPGETLEAHPQFDYARFLAKPYTSQELGQRIRQILDPVS